MTYADALGPLVAVMIGLGLADLATSFHRLVRAGRRVRWHWFPLASSVIVVLAILEFWWTVPNTGEQELALLTMGWFLPILLSLFLVYLAASAALPDAVPEEGIDLGDYYLENRGYFWLTLLLMVLVTVGRRLATAWWFAGGAGLAATLPQVVPNLVVAAVFASLAIIRRRWWHGTWLALLLVVFFLDLAGRGFH